MKGGKREGSGRPTLPDDKKKTPVSIKLPPALISWMDSQELSRARLIEEAIAAQHGLCRDCFRPMHRYHNCLINRVAELEK